MTEQLAQVRLTYGRIRDLVSDGLIARGYGTSGNPNIPIFSPGPVDSDELKASPDSIVFLVVGGGAGLSKEHAFDRPFVTVRIVGRQGNDAAVYDDTERLALDVDETLLAFDSSDDLGGTWTLSINRTGGRPALLMRDTAERYHFTASYIAEAETGI